MGGCVSKRKRHQQVTMESYKIRDDENSTEYDAFIYHNERNDEDRHKAESVKQILVEEKLSCVLVSDMLGGTDIPEEIKNYISKSTKTVVLVTKDFDSDDLMVFGMANAKAKARQKDDKTVALIPVYDISWDTLPLYIKEMCPLNMLDAKFGPKLCDYMKGVQISQTVPHGNIAHGLAWSHYYGYLALILPTLKSKFLIHLEDYTGISEGKEVIPMLFSLIPESCNLPDKFDGEYIKSNGRVKIKANRCGKSARDYTPTIYTVTNPDNHQEKYCLLLEMPMTVSVLYKMWQGRISDLQEEELRKQAKFFVIKLQEIIRYQTNPECRDRALVISVKDDELKRNEELARVIVKHCKIKVPDIQKLSLKDDVEELKEPLKLPDDKYEYDVYISAVDEDDDIVKDILLKKIPDKFKVFYPKRDLLGNESIMEGHMLKCRKVVTVITKNYMKSNQFERIQADIKSHAVDHYINNIPCMHGVTTLDVPSYMLELNHLNMDDEDFGDRLLKFLVAENVPLSASIMVENIAGGLAYAYYYNYLCYVLPGLEKRLKESEDYGEKETLYTKFVILLPTTGNCNKKLTELDPNIKSLRPISYTITTAATKDRDYSNSFTQVTDPDTGEEHYIVLEYGTPLLTLFEMQLGLISQLTPNTTKTEMSNFIKELEKILNHVNNKDCKGNVLTLPYDDTDLGKPEEHRLSRMVIKLVKEDKEKQP